MKKFAYRTLAIAFLAPFIISRVATADTNDDQADFEATKQTLKNDFATIATDKEAAKGACTSAGATCQAAQAMVQTDLQKLHEDREQARYIRMKKTQDRFVERQRHMEERRKQTQKMRQSHP